jgi:hypothetical protein
MTIDEQRPKATDRGSSDERWKFWRDVAVFELKILLDNVRDLVLMRVSLVAAVIGSPRSS